MLKKKRKELRPKRKPRDVSILRVRKAGNSGVQTFPLTRRYVATDEFNTVTYLGKWSKVKVTCRTIYHAVIVFFSHTEVRKATSCNGLRIRLLSCYFKISVERANLYLAFWSFCSSFFNVSFSGNKKGIRVSYGNKCGMRYLVKIGSGMWDPDPNVLIPIQNIFISKERQRLQATVLRVLDIFECLFLQIYLC